MQYMSTTVPGMDLYYEDKYSSTYLPVQTSSSSSYRQTPLTTYTHSYNDRQAPAQNSINGIRTLPIGCNIRRFSKVYKYQNKPNHQRRFGFGGHQSTNPASQAHDNSPASVPQPFWHQLSLYTQETHHWQWHYSTSFPERALSTFQHTQQIMDSKHLRPDAPAFVPGYHPQAVPRKPIEKVDVYIGDQDGENADFVRTMPLQLLVRFSKAAARAFPRPKRHTASNCKQNEALNQPVAQGGGIDQSDERDQNPSGETPVVGRKQLLLRLEGAYRPTHRSAINTCLDWMYLNSDIHNYDPLRAFWISEKVSLPALVHAYAAVLTLDMRPFPHHVCGNLMHFLTEDPPKAEDLSYLYYRVPDSDATLTRAITSIVEAQEKGTYQDNDGLRQLLEQEEWLGYRFKELWSYRNRSRKELNARSDMNAQWRVLEEDVARDFDKPKQTVVDHRRRPRREQRRKGAGRAAKNENLGMREGAEAKPEDEQIKKGESSKERSDRGNEKLRKNKKPQPQKDTEARLDVEEAHRAEASKKANGKSTDKAAKDEDSAPRQGLEVKVEDEQVKKGESSKQGNGRGKGGRHVPGAEY